MKRFPFCHPAPLIVIGGLVLETVFLGALPAAAQLRTALDPASLAAELRTLEASLSDQTASHAAISLPPAWEVETPERRYSISTTPLRTILASGGKVPIGQAKQWLDQLAGQLESFAAEPARSTANARGKLNRILARPEFAGAGPPSALERLRDRVRAWIVALLDRIFGFVASHPASSQILFWIVLAGTVGFLALWLVRLWSRDAQLLKLPAPNPAAHELRTWEEWLRAARKAAEQGDSRQAIHCAYWAGIVRLQGTGALPADRTRTPREYLGLLTPGPENNISAENARQPLAALTQGLERFWYARRAAGNEDFRESLRHLAALGCNVE
jgi:hypothetical protein